MLITTIILLLIVLMCVPTFRRLYVPYAKDNPNKLWFKRKLYGWGWTPVTREGWTITAGYVFLVFTAAFSIDQSSSNKEISLIFVLPTIILTIVFMQIAYKKGEKPRWQWGPGKAKSTGVCMPEDKLENKSNES